MDLAEHVDDAAALLDALSATPAVVIGRSTGGEIALALAHRHPDKVTALVLLEPAVFWLDPGGPGLGGPAPEHSAGSRGTGPATPRPPPSSGTPWVTRCGTRCPAQLREMFAATSPAVLAEIRGDGLDLSANPPALGPEELAAVGLPTLLVSAEDSPAVLRTVNSRLSEQSCPAAESVLVPGGHLINPAHPAVLDFVGRVAAGACKSGPNTPPGNY